MIFEGLEPWPSGEQLVEVKQAGFVFDLHNCASFLRFEYQPDSVTIEFEYEGQGPANSLVRRGEATLLSLKFKGISRFKAGHTEQEGIYESETLSDIVYQELPPDRGLIEVMFMGGFKLEFEAAFVTLMRRQASPHGGDAPG